MFNGVGLPTPRGSGTSGYVQRSLANLPPTRLPRTHNENERISRPKLNVNSEIAKHEKLRAIEVTLMELRVKNENKIPANELENIISQERQRLVTAMQREPVITKLIGSESSRLTEHKLRQNEKMERALKLGSSSSYTRSKWDDKRHSRPFMNERAVPRRPRSGSYSNERLNSANDRSRSTSSSRYSKPSYRTRNRSLSRSRGGNSSRSRTRSSSRSRSHSSDYTGSRSSRSYSRSYSRSTSTRSSRSSYSNYSDSVDRLRRRSKGSRRSYSRSTNRSFYSSSPSVDSRRSTDDKGTKDTRSGVSIANKRKRKHVSSRKSSRSHRGSSLSSEGSQSRYHRRRISSRSKSSRGSSSSSKDHRARRKIKRCISRSSSVSSYEDVEKNICIAEETKSDGLKRSRLSRSSHDRRSHSIEAEMNRSAVDDGRHSDSSMDQSDN